MKFRTEIEITSLGVKIGYENRVLALGSCFAAHIARKLAGAKFRVAENPSGILFNPLSIAAAMESGLNRMPEGFSATRNLAPASFRAMCAAKHDPSASTRFS